MSTTTGTKSHQYLQVTNVFLPHFQRNETPKRSGRSIATPSFSSSPRAPPRRYATSRRTTHHWAFHSRDPTWTATGMQGADLLALSNDHWHVPWLRGLLPQPQEGLLQRRCQASLQGWRRGSTMAPSCRVSSPRARPSIHRRFS